MEKYTLYDKRTIMGYDYSFKIVFIGNILTGKTIFMNSLRNNLTIDDITRSGTTIGVNMDVINFKQEFFDGTYKRPSIIKLNMWDTSGHPCFDYLVQTYYKNTSCFICFFDVYNYESYRDVREKINEIINGISPYAGTVNSNVNSKIILVGTLCLGKFEKRKRQVSYQEAKTYVESLDENCLYFDFNPFEYGSSTRIMKNVSNICMKNIHTIPHTRHSDSVGDRVGINDSNDCSNGIDARKKMTRSCACSCCDYRCCITLYNRMCINKKETYGNEYQELIEGNYKGNDVGISTGNAKEGSGSFRMYVNPMKN